MNEEKRQKIAQDTATILLKIGAVSFRFDPPFTFTSGLKSPIYLDNRIIMSYPVERRAIVGLYVEMIKEQVGLEKIDCISATATAAIPQGAWIAGELDLPMVFVRPTTKSYGKENKLEGYLKKGSKVLIVEDHISTAVSIVGNAETIREQGGVVVACVAATTYETSLSIQNLEKHMIPAYSLTTGRVIVAEACAKNIITESQKNQIDAWFLDPAKWTAS